MNTQRSTGTWQFLDWIGAWTLAALWIWPLAYMVWTAFHPPQFAVHFAVDAPFTLANFKAAWNAAPFARYFFNTMILVCGVLAGQLVVCTLSAYAFARYSFTGARIAFGLVLLQLMVRPETLLVPNYQVMATFGITDTLSAIGLPYIASGFAIFLLRQTFKTIPVELEDAARVEGADWFQILWKVYIPLAKPVYVAYALVSISYQWNNFLWPLVVTNSVTSRPLTVGLEVFSSAEQGIHWAIISAATLMTTAPLLIAFLLFQRQFIQSFMRAGVR